MNSSGPQSVKETISIELERPLMPGPVRVLLTVTGLLLAWGLLRLLARFALGMKTPGTVDVADNRLHLRIRHRLLGHDVRERELVVPLAEVRALEVERRVRHGQLVVGAGFLVMGLLCGVHWLLDGLRAGYPALFLLGAGVIAAGVAVDLALHLLIPMGPGRRAVLLHAGPFRYRLTGLSDDAIDMLAGAVRAGMSDAASPVR